jgi:hypothetical protein
MQLVWKNAYQDRQVVSIQQGVFQLRVYKAGIVVVGTVMGLPSVRSET